MAEPTRPVLEAPRVARRALCLGVLHMRSQFETMIETARRDYPDQEETIVSLHLGLNNGLLDWLHDEGHWAELTAPEVDLMTPPLGAWPVPPQAGSVARIESLVALAWALGILPALPPYDSPQAASELLDLLQLGSPAGDFVAAASLRGPAELETARDLAEFWLWRSRFARGRELAPEHRSAIASAASLAEGEGHFQAVDGDFPVQGSPYRDVEDADQDLLEAVAEGRLRALNWLCGRAESWDLVSTET